jgi:hypothetical protein
MHIRTYELKKQNKTLHREELFSKPLNSKCFFLSRLIIILKQLRKLNFNSNISFSNKEVDV